jgi:signal transduction histidine kinase
MADVIVDNIKKITATDRLRQELIANVSHDLRTPLAIMQGYIETLIIKKNSIHESLRDHYLSVVWDSSLKLGKLIEQLFEYSKLEANQIQPEKEPFLLSELISDLVFKYQILAKEKEILLKLDIPNQLPLVFADIALTERVIQNLLDNALKFTPKEVN